MLPLAKPSFNSEQIKYIFRNTNFKKKKELKTFFIKSENNPKEKKWDARRKRGKEICKNMFISLKRKLTLFNNSYFYVYKQSGTKL